MPHSDTRNWIIYKITSPTQRVYIGLTCGGEKRFSYYKKGACKNQIALYNSIKKYGFDSHELKVIESFSSNHDFALGKEMFWIRGYMSNYSKYPTQKGLNLTDGGMGALGRKVSEETKEKLRRINLGKKITPEVRAKLSFLRKGKKINRIVSEDEKLASSIRNRGYKHTQEAIKKISEASKGNKHNLGRKLPEERIKQMREIHKGNKYSLGRIQPQSEKDKRALTMSKPVIQYDLLMNIVKEYASKKEADRDSGCGSWYITQSLHGRVKSPKKFIFKFKKDAVNS